MLPIPLPTSKLILPLVKSKKGCRHMVRNKLICFTLYLHVEFCGRNAKKLFLSQVLKQAQIFNQGMTRQPHPHFSLYLWASRIVFKKNSSLGFTSCSLRLYTTCKDLGGFLYGRWRAQYKTKEKFLHKATLKNLFPTHSGVSKTFHFLIKH